MIKFDQQGITGDTHESIRERERERDVIREIKCT